MDEKQMHKLITRRFHLLRKNRQNLPYCMGRRYDRVDLTHLFCEMGLNRGVEVGVRLGRFSRKLCEANPDIELYCVDPWDEYMIAKYPRRKQEKIYKRAVSGLRKYNATIIRKTSMEALADFEDESLDFVYIDGNHLFDFVMEDIIRWSRKVRSCGIIGVHDFYGGEVGVVCAVEAYMRSYRIDPWYVTKESQPTAWWVKP